MYPAGESFATLASVAFLNSLTDATRMLEPTSKGTAALFPTGVFDIRLGGDASMTGSDRSITMPLSSTIITIGRPYGTEIGYTIADPATGSYTDVDLWLPFSVWDNDGADQDTTEQSLLFARDKRQNVFSYYGLNLQVHGQTGAKPRPTSPISGLSVTDYRWRFWYSRT